MVRGLAFVVFVRALIFWNVFVFWLWLFRFGFLPPTFPGLVLHGFRHGPGPTIGSNGRSPSVYVQWSGNGMWSFSSVGMRCATSPYNLSSFYITMQPDMALLAQGGTESDHIR